MDKTAIKLHIDFKESVDVKSFSDLLNNIDRLFLSQAVKNKDDIYRLQKATEYLIPKSLEIKEVNKGSIDLLFYLSDFLPDFLSDFLFYLIRKGAKHLYNKYCKRSSELKEMS